MNLLGDSIRRKVPVTTKFKWMSALSMLLAGLILGVIAKILDETASNLLPPFIEMLDLRNFFSRMGFWLFCGLCIAIYSRTPMRAAIHVFLFFSGMVSSYYLYTIIVAGFFPQSYMMIWVMMTIVSPVIAAVCWYARGTHPISIALSALIVMMMERQAFAFGYWYLDIRYVLEFLLLLLTLVVLYRTPRQLIIVIIAGSLLYVLTASFPIFWGML